MIRNLLILMVLATLACATVPQHTASVGIRPGQASQRCADDTLDHQREFDGAPHTHAVFFIDVSAVPGDYVVAEVVGTAARVVFREPRGTLTFAFPSGLGGHTVRATWYDSGGVVKAASESYLSVWRCK